MKLKMAATIPLTGRRLINHRLNFTKVLSLSTPIKSFPGCGAAWKSTATTATAPTSRLDGDHPTLVKIPSLPFLGTFIPQYSGTPNFSTKTQLYFWPEMKTRFGSFYRMGIPGLGSGIDGAMYVIQDPKEMARLLRTEGKYPSGTAEAVWSIKTFAERHYMPSAALVSRGPEWKRFRTFAQTDLLAPKAARRYLPAALEAARQTSKSAPLYNDSINNFLNLGSFEMFVNIMLGYLPNVADPDVERNESDLEFVNAVATALRAQSKLMSSIFDRIMVEKIGIDTPLFKTFHDNWATVQRIANAKVDEHLAIRDSNAGMSPTQENCYVNQAFERQIQQDEINMEEARDLVAALLSAGVDTTSNMLTWPLLHIAMHPEVQEKVVEELTPQLDENGHLTEESISPSNSPYLHAAVRESHRCASPAIVVPMKRFDDEIEVHGVKLPSGSFVALDSYSTGQDPNLVDDPKEFRPERFLSDAVEARKGTPSEIIDHLFFQGPFSQGARRCPGSRVALLEAHVFLAQLMLDYRFSIPSLTHWTECPYDQDTLNAAQLPPMEFVPRAST